MPFFVESKNRARFEVQMPLSFDDNHLLYDTLIVSPSPIWHQSHEYLALKIC